MKLLYGTGNQAKLSSMREHLEELGVEIIGIKDLEYEWPEINESGNDPLDNARIKAMLYYNACGMPVFSCDSGLYIEGLAIDRQPGVHVRNVNGIKLSDQEMIDYYSSLVESLGGRCIAQYKNAICFVKSKNEIYEYMGDDISGEKFELTAIPHEKSEDGFPLDRLSIHISSGKYYYDQEDVEVVSSTREGFQEFFKRVMKKKSDLITKGAGRMNIYRIDVENVTIVSEFMAKLKPEWWDVEGAAAQLSGGTGWYFGTCKEQPMGWLLCKSFETYLTGEIECLGYHKNGVLEIGEELQPLVEKAEEWAKEQGFVNMRFTMGSRGLSCHGKDLREPWEEIRDIHAINRVDYDWFLSMGYIPSGILPNIYGDKYHGILLVKTF